MIRLNLYWGGRFGVARSKPAHPTDPADPAYDWSLYDRTVDYAQQYGMTVLFSIYGTPGWANGGKGTNVAPTNGADLRNFAYAAATRYSGTFEAEDGRLHSRRPALARLERAEQPDLPDAAVQAGRRARWVIQSAIDYAKICNAVYDGVHKTLLASERVACGATGPRGATTARRRPPVRLADRLPARRSRRPARRTSTPTRTIRTTARRRRRPPASR